jgi:hypothetical protein
LATKRLSFLLLDANIIIELWRLGLWQRVVELCDIHVGRTVVDEADFFIDESGTRQPIDLTNDIENQRIHLFQVELAEVDRFRADYDPSYFARLDPGETEALVRLLNLPSDWRLCSADGIVFKILANIRRSEQGMALEEVLDQIGLTRRLGRQYTKAFRNALTKQGAIDAIQDRGRRR